MKAIIVGGGVGGPILAIALQRAGIEAEVFEARAADHPQPGSWLNFQANGMDALRSIDASGPLERDGYEVDTIAFVTGRGRPLGELPMAARRPDGVTSRMMSRRSLSSRIRDLAADRGIAIHDGTRFTGARYDGGGGVIASFADGSEATGDMLVGADGTWSPVRTLIDPAAARPRYVPVLNVGGYIPGFRVDVPERQFRMQFGTRCFFAWMPTPDGGTVWFANPPRPDEPERGELAAITDAQWRAELHRLMDRDAGPAHDIIDAAGALEAWATYDLPTVEHWHDGRGMVLLGDAAHAVAPSAGQGASMALEDAVTLARCLRDAPSVPAAFARYESLRRARTERIVAHGNRGSSDKAAGPLARVLRDAILPLVFRRASRDGGASMMWLQGHHIDFDERIPF